MRNTPKIEFRNRSVRWDEFLYQGDIIQVIDRDYIERGEVAFFVTSEHSLVDLDLGSYLSDHKGYELIIPADTSISELAEILDDLGYDIVKVHRRYAYHMIIEEV